MRRKLIGRKDFTGTVDVTDPCYDRDTWCRMNNVSIKPGSYNCVVWYHTEHGAFDGKAYIQKIVGAIGIYLDGHIPQQKEMELYGDIGVDSGLAGFFENKPDYSDEAWSKFCDGIQKGDAWLNDNEFFSRSGYGDGGYGVYAYKEKGEITALEIRFL